MIFRRTSVKTLGLGILFFGGYIFATWSAERHFELSAEPIRFGDLGRAMNHWDYVACASLVLAGAFLLVAIWRFRKGD
jgi:hypothetical protein